MLVNEKYELVAAALEKARALIVEKAVTIGTLTNAQYAYNRDVGTVERRARQLKKLESNFAELHTSQYGFDDTFQDHLNQLIKGESFEAREDRAFFGEIHAHLTLREKFFVAMDDLAAANDNNFSHEHMMKIKRALMKVDYLDERAISSAVFGARLGNHSHEDYARGLIDLLQETNGTKLTRAAFAAAVAAQESATAEKTATYMARKPENARQLVAA